MAGFGFRGELRGTAASTAAYVPADHGVQRRAPADRAYASDGTCVGAALWLAGTTGYNDAVQYKNAEDRLNPIAPPGVDDTTLGGYQAVHGRAAAFEGSDGQPYTVAIETEQSGAGPRPWAGYLVFVRWSQTGSAVMGHVETGDLAAGDSEAEVLAQLKALPLPLVKEILDQAIQRSRHEAADW